MNEFFLFRDYYKKFPYIYNSIHRILKEWLNERYKYNHNKKLIIELTKELRNKKKEFCIKKAVESEIKLLEATRLIEMITLTIMRNRDRQIFNRIEKGEKEEDLINFDEADFDAMLLLDFGDLGRKYKEALRKSNLRAGSEEQDLVFELADEIWNENHKRGIKFTKKNAIISANEQLKYPLARYYVNKNIEQLHLSFRQFQRDKKNKIKS
jgi:hypothetical protein